MNVSAGHVPRAPRAEAAISYPLSTDRGGDATACNVMQRSEADFRP